MACHFLEIYNFIVCKKDLVLFVRVCVQDEGPLGVCMYAECHVSVTSFNERINVRKGVIASLSCHHTP